MKCFSCGADIEGSATICGHCNSSVPMTDVRARASTFARLKSSSELARSSSPERIARLPQVPAFQKICLYVFFSIFIGTSALMCLGAFGAAGVIGISGGGGFSILPLVFAIVPGGFVVLGIFLFRMMKKKMDAVESGPAIAIPVVVIDKRTHVWGGSGDSSAKTKYYVTCETEDGSRNEYQVWDGRLYGQMTADDTGILFIRSTYGLDFDRVVV